jgi:multiple antibiotic resistance protein
MITAAKVLFLIVAALFPIVDPLGGIPLFLALTPQCAPKECRALSWRVAVNSFWVLIASYFVGAHVLAFFGVSLPVVQVGGGFLVVAIGWSMLAQKDRPPKAAQQSLSSVDLFRGAFYPLTMPVTVGPGAISVAITLGANTTHHYGLHVLIVVAELVAIAALALSVFLCYAFAGTLARVLGENGMSVIVRLSSFLLICIGVQIAWNGLSALLTSIAFRIR